MAAAVKVYQLSCTDSNASQALESNILSVRLMNAGANTLYFNFNGAATVAGGYPIAAGDEVGPIGLADIATVQAICDTGETATLHITAVNA